MTNGLVGEVKEQKVLIKSLIDENKKLKASLKRKQSEYEYNEVLNQSMQIINFISII